MDVPLFGSDNTVTTMGKKQESTFKEHQLTLWLDSWQFLAKHKSQSGNTFDLVLNFSCCEKVNKKWRIEFPRHVSKVTIETLDGLVRQDKVNLLVEGVVIDDELAGLKV